MIRVDVVQGTDEWKRARMAIPTASQVHRILTKKKRELSKQCTPYACELVAEWLLDKPLGQTFRSDAMERGSDQEQEAVSYYELRRDVTVDRIGFALADDGWAARYDPACAGNGMFGCSPDGLVGDDGGLEIKACLPGRHVSNMLELNIEEYEMQCQACMAITGRSWWDVLSYHPDLPRCLVRFKRDEQFGEDIVKAVAGFVGQLLDYRERLAKHRVERAVA